MSFSKSCDHFRQARGLITACMFFVLTSGCVANHPFPNQARLDVPKLKMELESKAQDEKALFDLTYLPFAHLDLKFFTETEDTENYPEGHTFVSVQSWLPLGLIVDGDVERFDAEQAGYEKNEFTSVLWGLWSRFHTTIQTRQGVRTERNYGLLWIFDVGRIVDYDEKPENVITSLNDSTSITR